MTVVVGITGGIGSGKSTLSNFLKKRGYKVHDSDAVVSFMYKNPSKKFLRTLSSIGLGGAVKNNRINKNFITTTIFNSQKIKIKLEKHIHNYLKIERKIFIKKYKKKKEKVVFLDIPLLFENHLERFFDETICIISTKKNRLKRIKKNKKFTKKTFNKILRAQKKDKERRLLAGHIINNNNTKKEFILKAKKIIKRMLS